MLQSEALFEWYCETLWRLRHDFPNTADDDDAWDDFYEDADIGFTTCFYPDTLREIEVAGLLDASAVDEGVEIRDKWLHLMSDETTRSCEAVRTLPEWRVLFTRCATLRKRTCPEEWQ